MSFVHKSINTLECELICQYDSIKNGYNIQPGGGVEYRQTVRELYTPLQIRKEIFDSIYAYRFRISEEEYGPQREAQVQGERAVQRLPELEGQLQREREERHRLEQENRLLREQQYQPENAQQETEAKNSNLDENDIDETETTAGDWSSKCGIVVVLMLLVSVGIGIVIDSCGTADKPVENSKTYIDRGKAKADKGEYSEAISDYDMAIRLDKANARGYYYRGKAESELGQHAAAIVDYDKAISFGVAQLETFRVVVSVL